VDVKLPALSENVTTGTVVKILVAEGDEIQAGQDLVELETEKAVAALPSPQAGRVVKVYVKEGDEVKVGQAILRLSETGASAKETLPPPDAEMESPAAISAEVAPPAAPPSVRKLADKLAIDLARVRGTGSGGRITMEDLRAYVSAVSPAKGKILPDFSKWGPVSKRPITALRKKISEKMKEAWTEIPHVTQFDEADATRLGELVKKYGPEYETKGTRLTVTALVIKAVIRVLKRHPVFNASLDEARGEIVLKQYYHLGLAVDTEQGLIVPVIRDADKKNLETLAKEIVVLAEKAKRRKVSLEDLEGGTFTISNQGGIGGAHFTPIIRAPEAAILGIGRARMKPVIREGKTEARFMMPLALSYDHRLIDGAEAARFIRDLAAELEGIDEKTLQEGGA
jgi:pyruvate dehydrogenase E2 component (dihydrolipoamide acetyltransferase)